MKKPSVGEETLALHMRVNGWQFEREYRFSPPRKWKFDFVILPIERKIAVEVEGGTWSGGRHVRGKTYALDLEKYNAASKAGWVVLRYTTDMVKSGAAEKDLREFLCHL